MNQTLAQGDTIETRLRLMGATDVQRVQGILYYVTFAFEDGNEVSYVYNINAKGQYFLQRIKPYPLPEGIFSNVEQVVEFIKRDFKKFKNAKNSSNFPQFLELTNTMNLVSHDMESFFLNYNVDNKYIMQLVEDLESMRRTIEKSKCASEHIIV
ncbi:MAG: hypothetical protein ACRC1P_08565 [Cellulosilyticaceae bacterium]